jgi:outer membrane protein assembly factor BamA
LLALLLVAAIAGGFDRAVSPDGAESAGTAARPSEALETIAAIQVHGNTLTTDDEVKRLAGVDVGAPFEASTIDAVSERLRATRRFQKVDVLRRFASIEDPTQILLVILVDEGAVRIERTGDPERPTRVVKTRARTLMFLPVLNIEDGYGVTYGARFAFPDPLGKGSRIGFPATWGGDKRAAVELEKTFTAAAIDRVSAGASVSRRTNPFFDEDDDRQRAWARAERRFARWLRGGASAGFQRVTFLGDTTTFGHGGADLTFDTRVDPVLPRNAVFARAGWEHIAGANRIDLDGRAYVGLLGQSILSIRGFRTDSDRPLQPFLKALAGGMSTVRGYSAGTEAGDTLVAASAELLVPLTSPLSFGRIGVSAFVDAGTAYDDGQRLKDQDWMRGAGGSVWFSAAVFRLDVAVAHGRGSSTRVHVGANVRF